ncbi:MAG: hypothetical protein Q7K42_02220, partial [Candidatus Diapherotrites archaeon]|nr:hypothetical protein [Candidatus Diapherotrites archaeon]
EKKDISKLQKGIEIISPKEIALRQIQAENRVKIIKSCKFVAMQGSYFVIEILSGAIKEGMVAHYNGKSLNIKEVESKLGNVAKTGMNAGIVVHGIEADEVLKDAEIIFSVQQQEPIKARNILLKNIPNLIIG